MAEHRESDQELVELALGEIAEPRYSELLAHLSGCARCRVAYDEIVAAVDLAVPAAPVVQPSAGFDVRVLTALDVEGAAAQQRHGQRFLRLVSSRVVLAAAALVLAVAVGVWGGVSLVAGGDNQADPASGRVALTTGDGEQVGTAAVGWLHDQRVLVMSVSRPAVGVGYRCRVLRAQGGPRILGRWEASSADGGTWVVPTPAGDITGVQLVTDSGEVWSSASLP